MFVHRTFRLSAESVILWASNISLQNHQRLPKLMLKLPHVHEWLKSLFKSSINHCGNKHALNMQLHWDFVDIKRVQIRRISRILVSWLYIYILWNVYNWFKFSSVVNLFQICALLLLRLVAFLIFRITRWREWLWYSLFFFKRTKNKS